MAELPKHVSAVTPLRGAIDGRKRKRPRPPAGMVAVRDTPLPPDEVKAMVAAMSDAEVHKLWGEARAIKRTGPDPPPIAEEARLEWHRRKTREYRDRKTDRGGLAAKEIRRIWLTKGTYGVRKALGMNNRELARRAGISEEQLSRHEREGGHLSPEAQLHLLDALGLADVVSLMQPLLYPSRPKNLADGRSDPSSYIRDRTVPRRRGTG